MKLNDLKPAKGSRKTARRVGRGPGSGWGKTSARGHKGQNARAGGGVRPGFEGGQMPLQRRLPKRGFKSLNKKIFALVHLGELERFEPDTVVDIDCLKGAGLIKKIHDGVKVLSDGEITRPIQLRVHKISRKAKEKVEAAGGRVEEISS